MGKEEFLIKKAEKKKEFSLWEEGLREWKHQE